VQQANQAAPEVTVANLEAQAVQPAAEVQSTAAEAVLEGALANPSGAGADKGAAGAQTPTGDKGVAGAKAPTGGKDAAGAQIPTDDKDHAGAQIPTDDKDHVGAQTPTGDQGSSSDKGASGAGSDIGALKVDFGIPDQIAVMSSDTFEFSMPKNAFASAKDSGLVTYQVTLVNDAPLPEYVSFDAETGKFTIERDKAPEGKAEMTIKVRAVDSKGNVAETSFKVTVQKGGSTSLLNPDSLQVGGMSLSDQMLAASDQHDAIGQDLLDSLRELNS